MSDQTKSVERKCFHQWIGNVCCICGEDHRITQENEITALQSRISELEQKLATEQSHVRVLQDLNDELRKQLATARAFLLSSIQSTQPCSCGAFGMGSHDEENCIVGRIKKFLSTPPDGKAKG